MSKTIFRAKSSRAPFRRAGFLFSNTSDWVLVEFNEGPVEIDTLRALLADPAITLQHPYGGKDWQPVTQEMIDQLAAEVTEVGDATTQDADAASTQDAADASTQDAVDASTQDAQTAATQDAVDAPTQDADAAATQDAVDAKTQDAEAAATQDAEASSQETSEQSGPKTQKKAKNTHT